MGGVTFGTSTYQTRGNVTGITLEGKEKKGEISPVKGSMIGKEDESTNIAASTCFRTLIFWPVPVYDGREGFQLGHYWGRPYSGRIAKGSTVMVLFTTKKADLPEKMQEAPNLPGSVKFAIYFNVLGIVVLEEPVDKFSDEPSKEGPMAYGVEKVVEYEEESVTGNGNVEEQNKQDIEEKDLDESFL
jgi:hypothetical protein